MRRAVVFSLFALAALLPQPARAQGSVADFYRGRNVTLIVGYSAGGGYDTYTRILARHLGKHIPGNPAIVVQNMPGAGSLKLANYLYNVAPKDGSTIGIFSRGMAMEPLIGGANVAVRLDEVHLARQRHQRDQRLRHLAHRAGEDLERSSSPSPSPSAARARAPIPTSTRCC